MSTLLAVDLGVRTGVAVYGGNGRLISYSSRNFGNVARLRRGAAALLEQLDDPTAIVIEGGGRTADVWEREAARRGIPLYRISAEKWRERLILPRERRDGRHAKEAAGRLARRVIEWSGAPRPTALRHDAAEAVLIGLWGVLELGWLETLPNELAR